MSEYEMMNLMTEMQKHCFGAYLFGTLWGIVSLLVGFCSGIIIFYATKDLK